eukprot:gene1600-2237_t
MVPESKDAVASLATPLVDLPPNVDVPSSGVEQPDVPFEQPDNSSQQPEARAEQLMSPTQELEKEENPSAWKRLQMRRLKDKILLSFGIAPGVGAPSWKGSKVTYKEYMQTLQMNGQKFLLDIADSKLVPDASRIENRLRACFEKVMPLSWPRLTCSCVQAANAVAYERLHGGSKQTDPRYWATLTHTVYVESAVEVVTEELTEISKASHVSHVRPAALPGGAWRLPEEL